MKIDKELRSAYKTFRKNSTNDSIYDEIEWDVYIKHGINAGSYHDDGLEGNNIRKWTEMDGNGPDCHVGYAKFAEGRVRR